MNPLLKLYEYGQSYWLDNLSRDMIQNGELEKRVREQGLRGVTSNPKIFNDAIAGSEDYDEQIRVLVEEDRSAEQIYEALAVKDVRDACDILRPVYDQSEGTDGFVSLEVSPRLARQSQESMTEARRLFEEVNRPNVMIKIPGTSECVPAIEEMLYEGVNVNITLLFSVESYETVASAYFLALKRRLADGKPVDSVASVASFFLSRIDVLVDKLLQKRMEALGDEEEILPGGVHPRDLLGKAAVANAKLAYQSFKRLYDTDTWRMLAEEGARPQRPLWASTGNKNEKYRDVRYVEPLIGPDTVTTMPKKTIEAFADHGTAAPNTVEVEVEEAEVIMRDLKTVGINFNEITQQLLDEGIQKFNDPYDDLMNTLEDKRKKFLSETQMHKTSV